MTDNPGLGSGVVMGKNRCSQVEAVQLLQRASSKA